MYIYLYILRNIFSYIFTLAVYDAECVEDKECSSLENAFCGKNNKCKCKAGYTYDSIRDLCKAPGSYETGCTDDKNCNKGYTCRNKKCVCRRGYKYSYKTSKCKKGNHLISCIANSWLL